MVQVIEVHRRLNVAPVRGLAFLKNALHLFVAEAGQSRERRRELSPIRDVAHRLDPDRSALQPPGTIELILRVARSVAFRAFCYFFNEVSSTIGFITRIPCSCFWSSRGILCSVHYDGRPSAEKNKKKKNGQGTCFHDALF